MKLEVCNISVPIYYIIIITNTFDTNKFIVNFSLITILIK